VEELPGAAVVAVLPHAPGAAEVAPRAQVAVGAAGPRALAVEAEAAAWRLLPAAEVVASQPPVAVVGQGVPRLAVASVRERARRSRAAAVVPHASVAPVPAAVSSLPAGAAALELRSVAHAPRAALRSATRQTVVHAAGWSPCPLVLPAARLRWGRPLAP
jgi:hypothetical protein